MGGTREFPSRRPQAAPAPTPTRPATGFQLSPDALRVTPRTTPIIPQQAAARAPGDPSDELGAAGYKWVSGNGPTAVWATPAGALVSQDEAVAELAALSAPFAARILAAGYIPIPGRPGVYVNPANGDIVNTVGGGGGGAQAPVERFSYENIGGKIYRFGDMGSAPSDTGITAPGFSNISVDDRGNLTGIDQSGQFRVIQPGFGFAKIDPERSFAEGRRQFDVGETNLLARSAADREAANQRALLSAQTAGFQTVAGLAPQLANVAQNQAQFQREVVSSPADFLFRAFSTRGQASPLPRVTQADFINNLAAEIERYNQTLQSFQPGPVGFQQPAQQPQAGFSGAPTTVVGSEESPISPEEGLRRFAAANPGFAIPQQQPTFAIEGGSAAPSGGISPLTRAGTPSFVTQALGVPQQAPASQPVPQVQATGFQPQVQAPSFQVPQIPVPQRTTQSELRALEERNRPPAVASILRGEAPRTLELGFQLPTPQQYGSLTPDERKAFGTTLATQYDVSPEDYEFAIQRRFGRPQERPLARVTGF